MKIVKCPNLRFSDFFVLSNVIFWQVGTKMWYRELKKKIFLVMSSRKYSPDHPDINTISTNTVSTTYRGISV